jgi:hypothetical protein
VIHHLIEKNLTMLSILKKEFINAPKSLRVIAKGNINEVLYLYDIRNFWFKIYSQLCGIAPLVLDTGGDTPPLDTEYNTWPFDAKGNLLFNIFKGAEHLAGVYRGGTFIFLTETIKGREGTTERVVGDIALPWDLEFVKLSRAVALKFNRKYWKWGNQWDMLPTLEMGIK